MYLLLTISIWQSNSTDYEIINFLISKIIKILIQTEHELYRYS